MLKAIQKIKIFIILILLSGCSENPPVIDQVYWQVNLLNDINAGSVYETFTLFLLVTDPDGIEDISSLYLINDREELFWKMSSDNWVIKENQENTWIGSNLITMHDRSPFPSGNYRVIIIDEAGEREEYSFIVKNSGFQPDTGEFPTFSQSGSQGIAGSNTDVVWQYNNDGTLLYEKYPGGKSLTIPVSDDTGWIYLYRYDRIKGVGLVSGPYTIR